MSNNNVFTWLLTLTAFRQMTHLSRLVKRVDVQKVLISSDSVNYFDQKVEKNPNNLE